MPGICTNTQLEYKALTRMWDIPDMLALNIKVYPGLGVVAHCKLLKHGDIVCCVVTCNVTDLQSISQSTHIQLQINEY